MWNSLKSDLYRMLHTKAFYITLGILVLAYLFIFKDMGVMSNTNFASFYRTENTFTDFLYYLPKSMIFQMATLIFLGVFLSDEYNSGFHKNVYPVQTKKWKLVIARFILFFIITAFFIATISLMCFIIQLFDPSRIAYGSFELFPYLLFIVLQILFMAAASSIMSMLVHLSGSKVVAVLFAVGYSMIIYIILFGISMMLFNNDILVAYTLYQNSGVLPEVFSWSGYQEPILVLCISIILYNGISYLLLKKKDIA